MAGCVLRVIGEDLKFSEKIENCETNQAGLLINVSDADGDEFIQQVHDAITFIEKYSVNILSIINSDGFELLDDFDDATYKAKLDEVTPLDSLIADYQPEIDPKDIYFEKEFILWGLVQFKKLSKYRYSEGLQFQDPYGSYISGL